MLFKDLFVLVFNSDCDRNLDSQCYFLGKLPGSWKFKADFADRVEGLSWTVPARHSKT